MASLSSRDRRALLMLGIAALLFAVLQTDWLLPQPGTSPASDTAIEAAEERLLLARTQARQMPLVAAESQALEKAQAAIETRLLAAETAALAQAEMREIMGELLRAEGITMQSSQFGAVQLEGEDFAQVPLIVTFGCGIERFVNLMAALANAPQLLSTRRIRITPDGGEAKAVRVQLTVSGYLPASKTPELLKRSTPGGARL